MGDLRLHSEEVSLVVVEGPASSASDAFSIPRQWVPHHGHVKETDSGAPVVGGKKDSKLQAKRAQKTSKKGTIREGIYKHIKKPEMAVLEAAFSDCFRLIIGEHAAKARVVYSEEDGCVRIEGIYSSLLPDFRPLTDEPLSEEDFRQEDICWAAAAILVSTYVMEEIDLHKENWGRITLEDGRSTLARLDPAVSCWGVTEAIHRVGQERRDRWVMPSTEASGIIEARDLVDFPQISAKRHYHPTQKSRLTKGKKKYTEFEREMFRCLAGNMIFPKAKFYYFLKSCLLMTEANIEAILNDHFPSTAKYRPLRDRLCQYLLDRKRKLYHALLELAPAIFSDTDEVEKFRNRLKAELMRYNDQEHGETRKVDVDNTLLQFDQMVVAIDRVYRDPETLAVYSDPGSMDRSSSDSSFDMSEREVYSDPGLQGGSSSDSQVSISESQNSDSDDSDSGREDHSSCDDLECGEPELVHDSEIRRSASCSALDSDSQRQQMIRARSVSDVGAGNIDDATLTPADAKIRTIISEIKRSIESALEAVDLAKDLDPNGNMLWFEQQAMALIRCQQQLIVEEKKLENPQNQNQLVARVTAIAEASSPYVKAIADSLDASVDRLATIALNILKKKTTGILQLAKPEEPDASDSHAVTESCFKLPRASESLSISFSPYKQPTLPVVNFQSRYRLTTTRIQNISNAMSRVTSQLPVISRLKQAWENLKDTFLSFFSRNRVCRSGFFKPPSRRLSLGKTVSVLGQRASLLHERVSPSQVSS